MIRPARLNDIPNLLEIENLSFPIGDRFSRNLFRYGINSIKNVFSVYVSEKDIPIGYIYILSTCRVYSLAVHPSARGNGIGEALLKTADKLCQKKAKVTLEVRKDNKKAIKFYLNNGYKCIGIRQNYYADGMDAIIMKKDLDNAKR